jgi:prepilin-type N-terminal cleavage/methylation domain-containing protein
MNRFLDAFDSEDKADGQQQRGFSLVEILVVVAVMAIVGLATATMIMTQQREVRALSEKLLALETQTQLNHVLFNSEYCGCLFSGRTFDPVTGNFSPGLNGIPDGFPSTVVPNPCVPTSSLIVPPVGGKFTGRNIEVKSLSIQDVVLQSPGNYVGKIVVELLHDRDTDKLVREIRPIESPIAFQVDTVSGTPTARPFLACSGASSGITQSKTATSLAPSNAYNEVSCPVGYRLTSCHADVTSGDGQSKQYQQKINYTGAPGGPLTGCNANMSDSSDNYVLVAICVK